MHFANLPRWATPHAGLLAATLAFATGTASFGEKPPVPSARLPLRTLGFPGYTLALMHAGASMATVHVLDSKHILFTYSLRKLVPRLVGDSENDTDRLVAAEIVEVPSGKVLEQTEWHLHDHGRYLWSAGQGMFLLRQGQELSTFNPMHGLPTHTAFDRIALPHRPGNPELVSASPDGKVLTVEMQQDADEGEHEAPLGAASRSKRTTIEFYRLLPAGDAQAVPAFRPAGVMGAPGYLRLAVDGDGYLWAEDVKRNQWSISFNEYEGKPQDLASVYSSCAPRLTLLSRSEFSAISCKASDSTPQIAVYGFDGHENWEEGFGETLQPPSLVAAPGAGRFAISRLVASSGGSPINGLSRVDPLTQEIRVYQNVSGDLLLHVICDPAVRTPENFDLSADGRTLAVLGREAIELYSLPGLTARDRKDLAEVQTMAPPVSEGPVVLRRITRPVVAEQSVTREETAAPSETSTTPVAAPIPDSGPVEPTKAMPANGDTAAGPDAPRKAPTLMAPGEKPEGKGQPAAPK